MLTNATDRLMTETDGQNYFVIYCVYINCRVVRAVSLRAA